jgi:hemerythrin-like domain-containing protein
VSGAIVRAMKRAPELEHLSHDHHHALDIARRLRRAGADDLEDVRARLNEYWETRGAEHFAIEERAFTPALCDEDPRWEGALSRMLREHEEIRAGHAFERVEDAHRLGELMHDHVRFEEREMFPIIEETLAPAELARLAAEVGGSPDDGDSLT